MVTTRCYLNEQSSSSLPQLCSGRTCAIYMCNFAKAAPSRYLSVFSFSRDILYHIQVRVRTY